MNINIFLMVLSLFYLFLIVRLYFFKEKVNTYETIIYKYILIFAIFGVIIDLIGVYASIYIEDTSIIRWIVLKLYYEYLLIMLYLLSSYMFISSNDKVLDKKDKNKFNIITIIFLISSLISLVLPVNYYKDGNIIYAYGMSTNFLYFCAGGVILSWLIYLFKDMNMRKLKNKKYAPMIIFVLLSIPIILIQMLNPELLLVSSLVSFIVVIMYHTIENPDVKMLNEITLAKNELEQANQVKSDFISSMSHEIRTPVNGIVGLGSLLLEEKVPKKFKEDVNLMIESSYKLLSITDKMFDVYQIEKEKLTFEVTQFNVKEEIESVIELFKPRINDKKLNLKLNLENNIVCTNLVILRKVISQVLDNALKFTSKGDINITSKLEKNNLIIEIEDSGIGINNEELESIFIPFNKTKDTKNSSYSGVGVGLSITKNLLDKVNGNIEITSKYNEWTKVILTIPVKEKEN